MSIIASKLIAKAVERLGQDVYMVRTATGGSVTTLLDASLEDVYTEEDVKYGTIIVTYDAGGAGAAPEGETGRISAYDETTQTFTIPTLTAALAAGDRAIVIMPDYPWEVLLSKSNEALRDLGEIFLIDTSLTSSESVTQYTLPTALDYKDPYAIYIRSSSATSDYDWKNLMNWRIEPAAPGAARQLIFPYHLDGGNTICIVYEAFHPELTVASSVVSGTVPLPLIEVSIAIKLLEWYGVDESTKDRANKLLADQETAKQNYRIWKPKRQPQTLDLSHY
jgi:hypothetical protein